MDNRFSDLQIDTEVILAMIFEQMTDKVMYFWNEKTDHRIETLEKAIDKQLYLSDAFKFAFSEEFNDICGDISYEAFEKGLKVGLGMIRSILTAEPPVIETAPAFERRSPFGKDAIPMSNKAGVIHLDKNDREYMDMVEKSTEVLTDKQKGMIMGEIQGFMFKNSLQN